MVTICAINPIQDPRWNTFVATHREGGIFHTPGWLEALRRTYGFQPIAYTSERAGEDLKNGLVFCEADSWLTGKKTISLPFSDHCQPLVDSADTWAEMVSFVHAERVESRRKFAEIRLRNVAPFGSHATPSIRVAKSYWLHTLDISGNLEDTFR